MKLNWGNGIAGVYILFVIGVLIMVVIFMNQDVSLETKDYYSKGIAYQNEIDKIKRTEGLPEQLKINVDNGKLKFEFPKIFKAEEIGGSIQFYRPSNNKKDFKIEIVIDSSLVQQIETAGMEKGLWKIKTDWNAKGIEYFTEKIIMVN